MEKDLVAYLGFLGVADFFSASCIPGAKDGPESLCQLCVGDKTGNYKCDATNNEQYYAYNGAFRYLNTTMKSGAVTALTVRHDSVSVY